jgi:hypothetical protein
MGVVAAAAVKRFARSQGVLAIRRRGIPRGEVRPVRNVAMTHKADIDGFVHEQRHLLR